LYAGLALLLLALLGLAALLGRSYPRQTQYVTLSGGLVPAATPTRTGTPTARPSPTTAVTPGPLTHVVQSGENLISIARQYGVTVEDIVEANGIADPNFIREGQVLVIPVQATQTPTSTATPTTSPTATVSPTPTPAPTTVVQAEWPLRMDIRRADSVRLILLQIGTGGVAPAVTVQGHTTLLGTPIATPTELVSGATAPEGEVFVVARLAGAAFDSQLVSPERQSMRQPQLVWEWNLMPKSEGKQVVHLSLALWWEAAGSDQAVEAEIWTQALEVSVSKPWLTTGQISLLSILSGLLGSVLSAPFLSQWWKERKQKARPRRTGGPR